MATRAKTISGNTSERSMAPKVRRGPRYRLPEPRPSVAYRGSLDLALAEALGLSADRVHQLRWEWPKLLGQAIRLMRDRGDTAAIAPILAEIDAACVGMTAPSVRIAFIRATEAEGATNLAEQDYLLDPSEANRKRVLSRSAQERLAEDERDALLRQRSGA